MRESTRAPGARQLAVATFNVENLDPSDADPTPSWTNSWSWRSSSSTT